MMKFLAVALVGMMFMSTPSANAQEGARTALASGDVRVDIVLEGPPSDKALMITFSSTNPEKHSVMCLSAHRDLTYTLKAASGDVIPMAAKFRDLPDAHAGSNFGPGAFKDYCATPIGKILTRIYLSDLYPELPKGNYKLWVAFASRDHQNSAVSTPISIKI